MQVFKVKRPSLTLKIAEPGAISRGLLSSFYRSCGANL
jgi:hypothetical protein